MSVSSFSTPFRKRSSMLSFESSRHELSLLERSRSHIDPLVPSRNNPTKSATLSRLVSSEGLDLGLPGVYRAKADDDLIALIPQERRARHVVSDSVITKSSSHDFDSFTTRYLHEKMLSVDCSPSDAIPPAKPPRTKVRRPHAKKVDDFLFDTPSADTKEQVLPQPLKPQISNNWTKVGSPPKVKPLRPPAPVIKEEDDNVFAEPVNDRGQSNRSPIYATVQKLRRKSKEKLLDEAPKKPAKKKDKFWRSSSDAAKLDKREKLKASLSMPFEFRKISLGGMPETRPIDLIGFHGPAVKTTRSLNLYDLPDLPPRNYVRDDTDVFKGSQGPDLLSHINATRNRTLSYNLSDTRKYQTFAPRQKAPASNVSRKGSWFSRHLSQRKSSTSDPHTESLLRNQVEPLDHSLLTRKDSRGSTEDENMENTHVDTKDKKKKEKKKDKKGKPPSRHGSDAKQSDKVRTKLKKFIGRRPTMESLQERGLIQESVFGCPLHKLCDKDGSNVPKFVRLCVEEVERRGLGVDGIYRVSGNLSHVQKLRYNIDRDVPVNLEDNEWEDIHVITGALKMFLRELPEPVIPFNFFDKFIATCQISDITARIDATRSLIRALPKPNNETLKYLMQHFVKVVSFSESNRMQVQNVAIVFGPTLLLKPPEMTNHHDPGGGHMAVYMMYQNQIVDYMLTEYKQLF